MLEGKVALVTGAGRGVGRAHALALAAAGARVVVNDLGGSTEGGGNSPGPAQEVVDAITAAGGTAAADTTDVSNWDEAAGLVRRTVEQFGRIDVLVSNAGICRRTAFGSLSEADWDCTLDVNAKAMAALIDAVARQWQASPREPGRAIVCTASPAGARPTPPLGIYGVSKAAVLAITQVAAQELAPLGVRVNAIAPIARTRMVGQAADTVKIMPSDPDFDRYLPDHIARLMLYLASPLCRFTGRLFGVRGDDVFLYEGWNAAHHVENASRPWTTEALAKALAGLSVQEHPCVVAPAGGIVMPAPSDEVMAELAASSA